MKRRDCRLTKIWVLNRQQDEFSSQLFLLSRECMIDNIFSISFYCTKFAGAEL